MLSEDNNFSLIYSLSLCFLLAVIYVGSLYLTPSSLPRDHPTTIKERFFRVGIACVVCSYLGYNYSFNYEEIIKTKLSFWSWMGIQTKSVITGIFLPLFLFMILFLGPICMAILDGDLQYLYPHKYKFYMKDLIFWRNFVVAPISEESVFRGCMLPILIPSCGCSWSILLAPSFFGVAHVHHALEKYYKEQYPISMVFISTVFQACYTTLFGALSSFVFLRTGHLIGVILCHSFCNLMGFPDFGRAVHHKHNITICSAFVIGLILFIIILYPLTDPSLYNNSLHAHCWQ